MTRRWCIVHVVASVAVRLKFNALLLAAIAAFLMRVDRNCINITKYVAIEVTVWKDKIKEFVLPENGIGYNGERSFFLLKSVCLMSLSKFLL